MAAVVGIRFGNSGRVHYFDSVDLDLSVDDRVIVETDEGRREGRVAIAPRQVLHSDLRGPLDPVLGMIAE